MNQIRYIQHEHLDMQKWDGCIREADNSLIYGYSWWLDNMSPGWHALVLNDYEAVMPLTWGKKYGIRYLYQPFCTAALGIFYKTNVKPDVENFFEAIPREYRYWDIDINEKNNPNNSLILSERTNQMLVLSPGYDAVKRNYSRLARRMLNKAEREHLKVVREVPAGIIIDIFKKEYQHAIRASDNDYTAIAKCCEIAFNNGFLKSYIANSENGTAIAFYMLLRDDCFVYSLLGGSTQEGKDKGAFYLLTDAAILDQCGSEKIFRFEGSDKEGIAFFNRQFGATPVSYMHVKNNRLPFPLKMLKK